MPEVIRVLVVDDHSMVAESFRRVLDDAPDVEVVGVVGTVEAAVACVADVVPDVVLMDYVLPDGNGVTATRRIREYLPAVKVILLTGSGAGSALPGALAAGCAGYVEKTTALEHLVPTVRAVVAGDVVIHATELTRLVSPGSRAELTSRERGVLAFLDEGLTNREIAERLSLSVHTVRTHVQTILAKLGAHSKLEAVAAARRQGLL